MFSYHKQLLIDGGKVALLSGGGGGDMCCIRPLYIIFVYTNMYIHLKSVALIFVR